jgi:VWFA-related protein
MKLTRLILSLTSVSVMLSAQAAPQAPAAQPRLLCMFFDLNTMDAAAQSTAVDNAIKFVQQQAAPSDRFAVMTYSSQVNVLLDFTNNRDGILAALRTIMPRNSVAAATPLAGLQAAISVLSQFPEKKAMLYFSSGVQRDAVDQEQLRATVDGAVRANVAIYPIGPNGVLAPPQ